MAEENLEQKINAPNQKKKEEKKPSVFRLDQKSGHDYHLNLQHIFYRLVRKPVIKAHFPAVLYQMNGAAFHLDRIQKSPPSYGR